jgi:hypothetical protein
MIHQTHEGIRNIFKFSPAVKHLSRIVALGLFVAGCSKQVVIDENMMHIDGALPADFSGSWQRDYALDDDVNAVLRVAYDRLSRSAADQQYSRAPSGPVVSQKDASSLLAIARLAELITRPDELTISQNEREIFVERKDDYSILCAFHNGVAKAASSQYGAEICGWDGNDLVSNLVLPDGLQVTHRFTISPDGGQLRVVTTVASSTSRLPFSLRRFYTKFSRPSSGFNCIETLSMKRVCSTGEIRP